MSANNYVKRLTLNHFISTVRTCTFQSTVQFTANHHKYAEHSLKTRMRGYMKYDFQTFAVIMSDNF